MPKSNGELQLSLCEVSSENWYELSLLKVTEEQRKFVRESSYYLALCAYGEVWKPLAIYLKKQIIGFMMWAYDEEEQSCWLGGIIIDKSYQRNGYGRGAVEQALDMLTKTQGFRKYALSYHPNNPAKKLYQDLGFMETGELAEDEIVARLELD